MTIATIDPRTLDSLSACDIADAFGCHYSGDRDPIEHGGFFYDPRAWREHGYASCVEFWLDPGSLCGNTLRVTVGTIHRPDDMESVYRYADIAKDKCDKCGKPLPPDTLLHMEIEACRSYCGIEPDDIPVMGEDGYCSPLQRSYKLSDWKEWRIWKSVSPLLASLGN